MKDRGIVGACCFLCGVFVMLQTGDPFQGAAVLFGLAAITTAVLARGGKSK